LHKKLQIFREFVNTALVGSEIPYVSVAVKASFQSGIEKAQVFNRISQAKVHRKVQQVHAQKLVIWLDIL